MAPLHVWLTSSYMVTRRAEDNTETTPSIKVEARGAAQQQGGSLVRAARVAGVHAGTRAACRRMYSRADPITRP